MRCTHCYQEDYDKSKELSFEELIKAFIQYKEIIDFFNEQVNPKEVVRPKLSLTGGEPFIREDFMDLLDVICTHSEIIRISILTNGTLITKDIAKKLSDLGIFKVQVSIDGDEQTHDSIRGKDSFKKAMAGIKHLVDSEIITAISFSAHKQNYKIFPKVVEIAKNSGADFIWSDRIIPTGSGKDLLILSKEETKEYVEMLAQQHKLIKDSDCNLYVRNNRALQFLPKAKNDPYSCSAGDKMLTLMPNGDVYPCRRMPIKIGNVRNQSLKDIYYKTPLIKNLRNPQKIQIGCEKCDFKNSCKGGLKCLSYAVYDSTEFADPGCWLVKQT